MKPLDLAMLMYEVPMRLADHSLTTSSNEHYDCRDERLASKSWPRFGSSSTFLPTTGSLIVVTRQRDRGDRIEPSRVSGGQITCGERDQHEQHRHADEPRRIARRDAKPASRVSPIDKLSLPLTILLAAGFLHESVGWRLGLGVALMTIGAVLTIR